MSERDIIMFRLVPTMRCNFRCEYCFVSNTIKENGATMFDIHSVEEWIEGIDAFSNYDIELYFWGGEPFCLDDTYILLREWLKREFIIKGIRIDTNGYFADKIVEMCPNDKIKLNCSYHMQYHSLEEEFRKVKLLKKYNMIGMVNFVASRYNLEHLKKDYGMSVFDLIEMFEEIGVFVNIAGDFTYANNPKYEKYNEYRDFVQQFVSQDDWRWLRGVDCSSECTAGQYMFTIEHNGEFKSCIDNESKGNFFEGRLFRDRENKVCDKRCPSIVAYPFRCDNEFARVNSLLEYIKRCEEHRSTIEKRIEEFVF